MKVEIRKYDPKTDNACIFTTWRNSAYYGASPAHHTPAPEWFRKQTKLIEEVLWDAKVRVACLENDPNTIVGYAVVTGDRLDWVYVKPDYRKLGIATILIPSTVTSYPTQHTKIGRAVLDKKKNKEN